jgi:lysophospholipase L1-like esterase
MNQMSPPSQMHRSSASGLLANPAALLHRPTRLGTVVVAALVITGLSTLADQSQPEFRWKHNQQWVGTWGTGPAGLAANSPIPQLTNQTLRLIVHTSVGGDKLRVRISNAFGANPIVIGEARVAIRASGPTIVAGSDRRLSFSGLPAITIPVGAFVISDAVDLDTPASGDLAVSLYLPNATPAATNHTLALQTSYVSVSGNFTSALSLPTASTITTWPFLTGVDVTTSGPEGTIVAFGDSITDGAASTIDTNRRWPNLLANRLLAAHRRLAVLDEGIIGNRILHPGYPPNAALFGDAALTRFDRDVLGQAGVTHVVVLLGINDIGHPGSVAPLSEIVTAGDIIAGLKQLIARAHEKGVTIIGATLLPFENTTITDFYSPQKEVLREAVNQWIRSTDAFDAVIDFDKAVRDPSHPTRLLPAYDGGDHLHPSDAGHAAMANAIDLRIFERRDDGLAER